MKLLPAIDGTLLNLQKAFHKCRRLYSSLWILVGYSDLFPIDWTVSYIFTVLIQSNDFTFVGYSAVGK